MNNRNWMFHCHSRWEAKHPAHNNNITLIGATTITWTVAMNRRTFQASGSPWSCRFCLFDEWFLFSFQFLSLYLGYAHITCGNDAAILCQEGSHHQSRDRGSNWYWVHTEFLVCCRKNFVFFFALSLSSLYRSVVNTLVLCMPFLFHNSLFLSVCLVVVSVSHRLFGATVRILNSNIETWYTSHVHIIVIVIGGK